MKHYYSAESQHGSESSHGFSNDTVVLVWDSKKSRDNYVNNSHNLSCKAIKRCDVTRNAANWSMTGNKMDIPRPFHGEYWGIQPQDEEFFPDRIYSGLIGQIVIAGMYTDFPRFYK